jgi:hypothetical protein
MLVSWERTETWGKALSGAEESELKSEGAQFCMCLSPSPGGAAAATVCPHPTVSHAFRVGSQVTTVHALPTEGWSRAREGPGHKGQFHTQSLRPSQWCLIQATVPVCI